MVEKTKTITARIEESLADVIEDIMWEANMAARKRGVKYPRCKISDVIKSLLKNGAENREKIKKELIEREMEKIKHGSD